jgi:hypothetical protein
MAGSSADIQKENPPNDRVLLPAVNSDHTKKWILIPAEYQDGIWKSKLLPAVEFKQTCATLPNSGKSEAALKDNVKIRRPPNAYIIFAKEWRKILAAQNPGENCQQISTRLGAMWKSLTDDERDHYMHTAHKLEIEHRRKYPNYVYCPNTARTQKARREEARELKRKIAQRRMKNSAPANTSSSQQAPQEQQVLVKVLYEIVYPEDARAASIIPKSEPS